MAEDKFERGRREYRDLVTHLFLESGHSCPDADVVWYPTTDAWETEGEFVVRMDLPGVNREDVQITLRDTLLEVQGVRREIAPEGRKIFHKMEIAVGPFVRRLSVPREFAGGEAGATCRDGVLEIRLRRSGAAGGGEIRIEPA